MATQKQTLKPAAELARAKPAHYPNESAEYRAARAGRTALLAEESDPSGDFTRDYVGEKDADMPAYTVFTRKDGTIRHFY